MMSSKSSILYGHHVVYHVDNKSKEGGEGALDVNRKARGGSSLRTGTELSNVTSKNKRRIIGPNNTPAHEYLFLFNILSSMDNVIKTYIYNLVHTMCFRNNLPQVRRVSGITFLRYDVFLE